jgi:hypothetical protein
MDRRNKIAQQLKWAFKPYCIMCQELKGKKSAAITIFSEE